MVQPNISIQTELLDIPKFTKTPLNILSLNPQIPSKPLPRDHQIIIQKAKEFINAQHRPRPTPSPKVKKIPKPRFHKKNSQSQQSLANLKNFYYEPNPPVCPKKTKLEVVDLDLPHLVNKANSKFSKSKKLNLNWVKQRRTDPYKESILMSARNSPKNSQVNSPELQYTTFSKNLSSKNKAIDFFKLKKLPPYRLTIECNPRLRRSRKITLESLIK